MPDSFDPYYTWLGIPPDEQPPNHYQLLGVRQFEDRTDVIANAVYRQMMHVRAFQLSNNSQHSQRILNELAKAKVCLLSPDKKQQYDNELRGAQVKTSWALSKPTAAAQLKRAAPITQPKLAFGFPSAVPSRVPRIHSSRQSKLLVPVIAAVAVGLVLIVVIVALVLLGRDNRVGRTDAGPAAQGTTGNDGGNTHGGTNSPSTTGNATSDGGLTDRSTTVGGATDGGSMAEDRTDGSSTNGGSTNGEDPQPPVPVPSVPSSVDGSIDLMSLIDSSRYAISGNWTRQGPFLRCSEGASAFCAIPYEPKGAYELQFDVRRLVTKGVIQIHLPVGDTAVVLALHGKRSDGQYVAGLALSDGTLTGTAAAVVDPPAANVVHRVHVKVTPQDSNATIVADMDGKQIAFWSGPQVMLSSRLKDLPSPRRFVVGGYSVAVEFQSIRLFEKARPPVAVAEPSPPAPVSIDGPPTAPPREEGVVRIEAESMQPVGGKSDIEGDFVCLKQLQSARELRFEALQDGEYTFRVRAFGQQFGDEPAKLSIILNGKLLHTFDVPEVAAQPKRYNLSVGGVPKGRHTLRIQFANHLSVSATQDRHLLFDYLDIVPPLGTSIILP